MGRDKALIEVEGVPLLRRVCEVGLQLSESVFVMTAGKEAQQTVLPESVQVILETEAGGPLVAFEQGLAVLDSAWVLLLACDLPCLDVEVLRNWVGLLGTVSREVVAVLPRQEKGWEPLCGFYRRECAIALREFVFSGGRSFQRWLMTQQVQALPLDQPRMLLNCNTIADLAMIRPCSDSSDSSLGRLNMIEQLNELDQDAFVAAVGFVFEATPAIASQTWHARPFQDLTDLHQKMLTVVNAMTDAEKLTLIQAHPDLGSKAKMAEASVQEQSGAGLDQLTPAEFARFESLNSAYKERFGFPFIIAVKNHTKTSILDAFEARSQNSLDSEIQQAITEIGLIAKFRLLGLSQNAI